ncbi:MAG: aminoacyl-tRNA hydrolase [Acidimicrobiales bacterium]|nr:aminoacyl-tRNA hydrolase [Acidimicrobiales bacterium]
MSPLRSSLRVPEERRDTPADFLIVGLGNPGPDYERTRHNAGFEVVSELASRHGGAFRKAKRERALVAECRIGDRRVVLAQPQTFMNASGEAVAPLVRRFGIEDLTQLVVVHDELDLPLGRLKVKLGGGLAGHNGLRSIRQHLHSDAFVRVRIGVGKPPSKEFGAEHVLRRMGKLERAVLDEIVSLSADATEVIVLDGVEVAMNRFNATDLTERLARG